MGMKTAAGISWAAHTVLRGRRWLGDGSASLSWALGHNQGIWDLQRSSLLRMYHSLATLGLPYSREPPRQSGPSVEVQSHHLGPFPAVIKGSFQAHLRMRVYIVPLLSTCMLLCMDIQH